MSETVAAPVAEMEQLEIDTSIKLFVGNLSYSTTSESLREELSSVGELVNCDVVVRQLGKVSRPLGYGFVSYATQADADACVEKYNKTEFEGRELNVEPAQERKPKAEKTRKPRKSRKAGAPAADEGGNAKDEEAAEGAAPKSKRERKKRTKRVVKREESPTLVYVANLPFNMDDAELSALFSAFKVVSTNLVTRHNGRSMGYGFVDLESHEEQTKAIAAMDGTDCKGRELSCKVALEKVPKADDAEDELPAGKVMLGVGGGGIHHAAGNGADGNEPPAGKVFLGVGGKGIQQSAE